MRLAAAVSGLILLLAACGSGAPADRDVLVGLADGVAVPAYASAAEGAAQLDRDAQALCAAPDSTSLEAAQAAWRSARAAWLRTSAMGFGPVMDRRSTGLVDWASTDPEGIDRLLAEERGVTAVMVRDSLPSNQRGFGAIDRLLFMPGVLDSIGESPERCAYLQSLTAVVRDEIAAIHSEWVDGTATRAPYKDYVSDRASVSLLPSTAVAEVVRTQVFLIRTIVDMRLASAMGLRGEGPDFTALPGDAADNGLEDLRNELLGMRAAYEGAGEGALGVSDLVVPLSEETDLRLRGQFDAALAAIDAAEGPLREAITQRPAQVREVYDRLSELQRTISVEVVSLLGVSVGFSDTDGDTLR